MRLVDDDGRGDPQLPLRWMAKSVRSLSDGLGERGHRVRCTTVAQLLRQLGCSLQANAKVGEGVSDLDRDAQFAHSSSSVTAALAAGQPVISVDMKKKEPVAEFKAVGRELRRKGSPLPVQVHDVKDPALGKAIAYGIYDLAADTGWVNVGIDDDSAQFAVASIRGWWQQFGRERYPDASSLAITADCGGSNSYRTRLWKTELQQLADQTGLQISVCHFPPATSKWNTIEHRHFCFITKNGRGKPLVSLEVIINLIAATSTFATNATRCAEAGLRRPTFHAAASWTTASVNSGR